MKKFLLCWLLALSIALTPVLTACSSSDNGNETESSSQTETESESQTAQETETEATSETETETETEMEGPALIDVGGVSIEEFVIIYASDASDTVMSAIEEMISLVAASTGHTLRAYPDTVHADHEIVIGQAEHHDTTTVFNARQDLVDDGYVMMMDNGHLYISGAIDRGTVYGVYDFLEQYLGVRFYSAFDTHTRADGRHDVPADLFVVFNPVFSIRNQYAPLYDKHGAHMKESGILGGGGSFDIGVGGVHNLGPLSGTGGQTDTQPCVTDETIYQTVLTKVLAQAAKLINGGYINVMQNDCNTYCVCENCQAIIDEQGSAMGPLLAFINRLAVAVREAYPDRKIYIQTLAYTYSVEPPLHMEAEDNVIVQLCSFEACFAHAFNDPDCPPNVVFYDRLQRWAAICDHLTVWDYAANDASRTAIGPNLDILWDNMQVFRDNNVMGQFQQQHGIDTGEFSELRAYLIGHAMWNPNMTREAFDKLRDEFMEDYYGEAAPYIQEYIDLTTKASRTVIQPYAGGHTAIWTDGDNFYLPLNAEGQKDYTWIDRYVELWENAFACSLTPDERAHAEKSSLHFYAHMQDYAKTMKDKRLFYQTFDHLRTKYTYAESVLPEAGHVGGVDPTVPSEGLVFDSNGDGTCYVSDIGSFTGGLLVIPSVSPDGDRVTAIAPYAFSRCTNLVSVIIPEGVTDIGEFAFRGCDNLVSVILPSSLARIGFAGFGRNGDAYSSCHALTNIYFLGTEAQWAAVKKGGYWDSHTPQATVHCGDSETT